MIFGTVECSLLVGDIVFDKDAATLSVGFLREPVILCFDKERF